MSEEERDDVALKLLHTADWHLGRRFPSFDARSEETLCRARLEVIERILGEAEQHQVDAVLCCGDLFDEPQPGEAWWGGLKRLLVARRWTRPLFLLPGNHDPLEPGSPYEPGHPFRRGLPDYVHVIDRDDYTYDLSDDAVLHAVPCRSQEGQSDSAMALPARAPGDERLRVGMVHGQTFDIEGCQTNFPIARDAAEKRGLDYLAIGDTHGFRDVVPSSAVPIVYPGAPEPTNFGEVGAGGVALVLLTRHGRRPLIERLQVARWRWRTESVTDLAALRAIREEDLTSTVLRLRVDMRLGLADYAEAEAILRELEGDEASHGLAGVLDLHRDGLRVDAGDVGSESMFDELPPVLRRAVDRLQEQEGEHGEVARRALLHLYRLIGGGG